MKRVFSILTVVVFIAGGMQMSVVSHYCEGKLADVRVSVTGEKATCGMENPGQENNSIRNIETYNCCEDHVVSFTLANYENTPSPRLRGQNIIDLFIAPDYSLLDQDYNHKVSGLNLSPPGDYFPKILSCPELCIFRI